MEEPRVHERLHLYFVLSKALAGVKAEERQRDASIQIQLTFRVRLPSGKILAGRVT